MDSKILFDKIDNCFIKFRNGIKNIRRKVVSKTYQSRQVNDNETDSKAD